MSDFYKRVGEEMSEKRDIKDDNDRCTKKKKRYGSFSLENLYHPVKIFSKALEISKKFLKNYRD